MGTGDFSHYMSKMSDRINLGEGFILVHSFVAGKHDGVHGRKCDGVHGEKHDSVHGSRRDSDEDSKQLAYTSAANQTPQTSGDSNPKVLPP